MNTTRYAVVLTAAFLAVASVSASATDAAPEGDAGPDNHFLAGRFTFDPSGTQQAWFIGMGTYSGNSATVDAVQPTGGAWIPRFDPTRIVNNPWGTLTFTFKDCNHGHVDFSPSAAMEWAGWI